MKTTGKTKRITFISIGLACLFALSASASPLPNGSFEKQPLANKAPEGWTSLDGTYWTGMTDDSEKVNKSFALTGMAPADGDYFIRRNLYAGMGPITSSYWSASQDIFDVPLGTESLRMDVESINSCASADVGKIETYGTLIFFDGENGAGTAIETYQTDHLPSRRGTSGWCTLTGTFEIPTGAMSYKAGVNVAVISGKISTSTYANFDNITLTPLSPQVPMPDIPEPSSTGLNLDFRHGGDQWEKLDGNFWRVSPTALSHGKALQRVLYPGTPASIDPFEARCVTPLSVQAGRDWLVAGYVTAGAKWNPDLKMTLHLTFYDSSGREVGQFETTPRAGLKSPHLKNYSRISGKTIVPENAVTAQVAARVYAEAPVEAITYVMFDNLWVGDFSERVAALKAARYDAPKPPAIRIDAEDSGPIRPGILNRGKFYTYSSRPSVSGSFTDQHANKWTDGTLLTDGEIQIGRRFSKERYVGWKEHTPTTVLFDLGRPQQLSRIRVYAANDPEVYYYGPKEVQIRVRRDRTAPWVNWLTLTREENSTGTNLAVIEGKGPLTTVLEVEVTLVPDDSNKYNKMLLSEIELLGNIKNTWRNVPSDGRVYNGAYPPRGGFDQAARGGKKDSMRIDLFEEATGKPLSFVLWYQAMKPGRGFDEIQEFRRRHLSENFYGNRLLIYGWLPTVDVTLADIAAGKYDAFFEQYFRDSVNPAVLMGNNDPVIFRPMNEFDSSWVPYGHQPELLRKAWWRIYNIAEKLGAARKHIFCWSPNHRSYPEEDWNRMEKYYPGDQYVDWIGVSAYPPSRRFVDSDADLYPIARCKEVYSKFGYKPVIISEGGFGPDHVDNSRWVEEWFTLQDIYPNFIGYIWENHFDRVIQGDEAALKLYREKVQDPHFISTTYTE